MVAVTSSVSLNTVVPHERKGSSSCSSTGQKNDALYNPSGLMSQARSDGGDGMIYVAINYRLGLFGWLNGNGDDNVFPNVALQDQLFALKW